MYEKIEWRKVYRQKKIKIPLLQMIPAEGVKVVQGLLHSHLLGRELYLRQIRDGKELPMVFSGESVAAFHCLLLGKYYNLVPLSYLVIFPSVSPYLLRILSF